MDIYIVRHCKAEGQSPDANLTDEGYLQAERLAEFLYDKKIESIICSPFVRANQSLT
jgi:2,3-bisphosphoglycerate-dependent phosphoglycerate mutase